MNEKETDERGTGPAFVAEGRCGRGGCSVRWRWRHAERCAPKPASVGGGPRWASWSGRRRWPRVGGAATVRVPVLTEGRQVLVETQPVGEVRADKVAASVAAGMLVDFVVSGGTGRRTTGP